MPGIYKTSAENIGYQLRQLDRSLDGWSNGGKVPDVIKFIADLNPIVSVADGIKTMISGVDIYNQPVKGQYSQGAWKIYSGITGWNNITPRSIIIDQTVPVVLDKTNLP